MSSQYILYANKLKDCFKLNKISFRKKYNLFYNIELENLIDIRLDNEQDLIYNLIYIDGNIVQKNLKKNDVKLILKYKNDINMQKLYRCIKNEQEQIAIKLDNILSNLVLLNETLVKFKREPQDSLSKSKKILKNININLYDFIYEEYYKETEYIDLIKDLRINPYRRFPLEIAKKYISLKQFLKHC
jgi:hypothetical protein